jgi:hypothetical protein
VAVYPAGLRIVAATLFALSRGSLGLILVRLLVARDPPITPPILFRLFVLFAVVPAAALWVMQRAARAEVNVEPKQVLIRRRSMRIEIPTEAIDDVVPWLVPFPGPGFSLELRSGRRLRQVVEAADPGPLLGDLADRASVVSAQVALRHPVVVWAHAKSALGRSRWYHYAGKYVVFALFPAGVLFNAHQHIAYGGLLGQYYLEGLGPYLTTLAVYWTTTAIYLLLYASVLRALAEGFALAAAGVAPGRALGVRRAVEIAYRVLYFGGVPVLLALRFSS